jgi:two-component system CheB/CheR fusion protein
VKVLRQAKPQRAVLASAKRRPRERSSVPLAVKYARDVLQGIIDTTSDLVAAHDLRGRYIAFNEGYRAEFARVFGVEVERGDSMLDALSRLPRDRTKALDIVQRALRGEAFTIVEAFGDERRARKLYEIRCAPLRHRHGRIIGAAYFLRDVTEKHRVEEALREARRTEDALRESEARFRAAIDHFPGTFAIYDTDRCLRFVNATGLARARRREGELLGRREEDVFRQEIVAPYLPARERAFETGETQRVEWSRPGPSGDRTFVGIFVPLKDEQGRTRQVLGIAQEITERKRVEQALRDADRRKDEFLGVLSHELRNPLAPVRNALWLLDQGHPGGERAARAKEIINRQVAHLSRLVDDLLDVTRITRGKIHLQKARIDLLELVRRTIDDHRTLFSARAVALTARLAHPPIWIDADPTRVSQVVGNLLQNAAKFTNPGGSVEVRADRDAPGVALVEVRDDGVGIAPAILGRIFEPFTQADESLHRTRGGLGLGLALVKGLVELHGGSVEARSEGPGRGAAFVLRLPLAPEQRVVSGDPRIAGAAIPSHRVLVIEDNADAAETLREMLEMWGHEVVVAHDGRAGVEAARAFRPDIVLCDIGLPVMDGYEVARAIRANPEIASTFLVAVTGYALPEDQRRAAEAGFVRHLGKPVPIEVMEEVLATAPRRRSGPT